MFKPFSRRQSEAKKPESTKEMYTYNIESDVRNRILYTFADRLEKVRYPDLFAGITEEVPQALKKSDEYGHQAIVRPRLDALAGPAFKTANDEMLKAHATYRNGDYPAAITYCGSAFESVLKTICDLKAVAYDPNKDTCGRLVEKGQAGGLFPSFYTEIFKAAGTLRNQLSSSHGRGPKATLTVTKEQADHMIQMTSAHITFLVKTTG
jgi:Domain of unknown function (DUF7014)/Abortive infection C-terminus